MTKAAAFAAAGDMPKAKPNADGRPIGICVFGCTGNAGRAVAFHAVRLSAQQQNSKLTIGLAGRSQPKVQSVLDGILAELSLQPQDVSVEVVLADLTDEASMLAMARRSCVVVGCAGPYGRYGEATVKACVDGRAHYVDITGEVPWVERMITDYDDKAKANGVTLLPFAGYDCIPAEIGMYLAGKALQENDDEAVLGQINLAFRNKGGGFPRGTLNTILDSLDGSGATHRSNDKYFYSGEYRPTAKAALAPSTFLLPQWSTAAGQYTGPNFMAAVNVPILCRSAPEMGFDNPDLVITDRSVVSGRPTLWNGYGLVSTQMYISALVFGGIALTLPPVRWWLRRKLQSYTYGGDPNGQVIVNAEAICAKNSDRTATAQLTVPGEAGIYATGLFAAATANALYQAVNGGGGAPTASSLPPAGFHTPVAALHNVRPGLLVDSLTSLGATVQIKGVDGHPIRSKL